MSKPVVATTSLAGCFGCHMSLLDIDERILQLIELVEFNKSPVDDIKTFTKQCDIGLIEGGCCNSENVEVLKDFRKNCKILVSLGECAIMGGIPAMRNFVPLKECLEESYINGITSELGADIIPGHDDIPKLLNNVYPSNEIVKIDYYIPGCPPNAQHIWKVVKNILLDEDAQQQALRYTMQYTNQGIQTKNIVPSDKDASDMGFSQINSKLKETEQTGFGDIISQKLKGL